MARNNLSSLIRLDDAFSEAPRGSRLLMYGSILTLFALTFYGAWLMFWSWVAAILVAISSCFLLFYIQYKAILVKSENRFTRLPFVHMVFFLFPLSCISFFSLHALTLHFNFQEEIKSELDCKALHLTEMIDEFAQFEEDEMNRVWEVYNNSLDNNTSAVLLCQPFNLDDGRIHNLKSSLNTREVYFEKHIRKAIESELDKIRKDLDTEYVIDLLSSDYDWSTIVTTLRSYDDELDTMIKLQLKLLSIINASSACTSLASNSDTFVNMGSLTRQWDVSKKRKDWKLILSLGVILLCTIMPIMKSDPSDRD